MLIVLMESFPESDITVEFIEFCHERRYVSLSWAREAGENTSSQSSGTTMGSGTHPLLDQSLTSALDALGEES